MATPLPGGSTSRSAKVTPPVTELKPIEDLLPELLLRPEHLEDPGVEKWTGHAPWTTAAPQTSETVAQPEAEEPTAAQRSNHSVGRPSSAGAEDGSQRQKVQVSRPQTDHSIQRTTEAPFPFFSDDDCPPDCSCYGRVVQCCGPDEWSRPRRHPVQLPLHPPDEQPHPGHPAGPPEAPLLSGVPAAHQQPPDRRCHRRRL
ncbi:uncharacterized protein LOC128757636 isoform X1 [Synchiropus splendidus]|uniref:uncharacterized protein LOC128757636 isoform X1 n=1 Tax=Synchiropus splendidus TaxID=270530 RepID=UPI00237D47F2|nr:uncharacterized protein LOC128757636 isoform X1 [Synchiropus splendidus]XP_053719059.1 uncharacterized protein LOC128757636 isoform X1 [Synchiropus splendidus]